MYLIKYLLDVLIPRFVTDPVALIEVGTDVYEIVGMLEYDDIEDDEFDHIAEAKCFNFFGVGLFTTIHNITKIR
jgi:hypothetical protein